MNPIDVMRQITGTTEAAANSTIVSWAKKVGELFPDMASYCAQYTSSTIAWCGESMGYCMAMCGIRPPYDPSDDMGSFFYALSWRGFGVPVTSPQPGDVLVFAWAGGGHHVTFYESTQGSSYVCRGGNQSDSVRLSTFPASSCIAIRRPPAVSAIPVTAPIGAPVTMHSGITATMFGGSSDPNTSAYDGHVITDTELGVALPYHFKGARPQVRVWKDSRSVICSIVDVGPWNTNDPYWQTNARPQAESGTDMSGRHTNLAGIDLTPAAAKILGIDGKGIVSWEFVDDTPAQKEPTPVAQIDINAILAAIQPQIQALIQQAVAQAAANAAPPAASVPVVIAPPPIVAPTAPVQITMASTIAHIEPVLTLFNKSIAGFIPPPYNLIPLGLAGVGHIIAASSGQVQATPDSIGQAVNDIAQAGLGGLHAGGINLPPWLTAVLGALHPVATVDPAAK
jgi:uncharacterized protein (TIGR02594 family)